MQKLNKKGFTLVEALIVIILIAIGAAIAFSFLGNPTREGRLTADVASIARDMSTVSEGWSKYFVTEGTYPADFAALVADGTLKAVPPMAGTDLAIEDSADTDTANYAVSPVVAPDVCAAFNARYAGGAAANASTYDATATPVKFSAQPGMLQCVTANDGLRVVQHLNNN